MAMGRPNVAAMARKHSMVNFYRSEVRRNVGLNIIHGSLKHIITS